MTPARLDQILDELKRDAPPAGSPFVQAYDHAVEALVEYRTYQRCAADANDVSRLTERRDSLAGRRAASTEEHEVAGYDRFVDRLARRISRLTADDFSPAAGHRPTDNAEPGKPPSGGGAGRR